MPQTARRRNARRDCFGQQSFGECDERHRAELALLVRSNGYGTRHRFFVSNDGNIGVAHEPCAADLGAELVGAEVGNHTQALAAEVALGFLGVGILLLADREETRLFGREPYWKRAAHVLDVDAEEAFERA